MVHSLLVFVCGASHLPWSFRLRLEARFSIAGLLFYLCFICVLSVFYLCLICV